MTSPDEKLRLKALAAAFQMPSFQTMVSRKSSVTNAAVNSVIPAVAPTSDQIEKALAILGMEVTDVRCAYCGDPSTEWDHLRPLVINRRPTGYISEIANLVPACGKCNQSKGNKPWRIWMLNSSAKLSPTGRGLANVTDRISRLEAYEQWLAPTHVDFEALIGREAWEHYWSLCEAVIAEMRECQKVADGLRDKVAAKLDGETPAIPRRPS
ncbi:MAG TPA: HNH endonuclease [Pirellulales bacterium]|nr:HNH endonuclease [Pirellulales bacterium]